MSGLSRIAIAAALVAGFGSLAEAQSRSAYPSSASDYYGLAESRSAYVERAPQEGGAVPPSVSHTVMGLSVPR